MTNETQNQQEQDNSETPRKIRLPSRVPLTLRRGASAASAVCAAWLSGMFIASADLTTNPDAVPYALALGAIFGAWALYQAYRSATQL